MSKHDATQKYTLKDYDFDQRMKQYEMPFEKIEIIYPKPIEPDKPKFDGIHTIGTLKGLTKNQINQL